MILYSAFKYSFWVHVATRNEESVDKPVTEIDAVLSWTEELKRRVPAN